MFVTDKNDSIFYYKMVVYSAYTYVAKHATANIHTVKNETFVWSNRLKICTCAYMAVYIHLVEDSSFAVVHNGISDPFIRSVFIRIRSVVRQYVHPAAASPVCLCGADLRFSCDTFSWFATSINR